MQDISFFCEKGGREYNQDCVLFSQKNGKFCIAVADGLGSYVGSEIASKIAVKHIISWFNKHCDDEDVFSKAVVSEVIRSAHEKILAEKESDFNISSSCTTIAVVISDNVTSVMAHIGDTRIYEIKNGTIVHSTKDHSLAQVAVEKGEITRDDIPVHVDQNKLLRVLGSDYYVGPDVKTDFFPLKKGDGFLVCTDGLWEFIYENEIEYAFAVPSSSYEKLEDLKKLHNARANDYCDNFSAVLAVKGE